MKKALEFKAHDGEIEDITLGPDNKVGGGHGMGARSPEQPREPRPSRALQVVTAGRDLQCRVWQRDQLVTGLQWNENLPGTPSTAYRYQACRWVRGRGAAPGPCLGTVVVVVVVTPRGCPSLATPSAHLCCPVPASGRCRTAAGRCGSTRCRCPTSGSAARPPAT